MRLARYGEAGAERPALVMADGTLRDLSSAVADITATSFVGLARFDPRTFPQVAGRVRLGPPVGRIGKIIGVGLNYRDHAAECGFPIPNEPTLFLKPNSSLAGPSDPIVIPRGAEKVDWEVELGVVIGRAGVYIDTAEALAHVAGYCVGIDVSERAFQFDRGGHGFKGKAADSFCPLGPWLVTANAVDPQNLRLTLTVNGETRQDGSTADMIFDVARLVSYASQFMSLQPGDVILTGTPAGVGMGREPPVWLAAGDEVVATIDGLGTQRHRVIRAS